MSGWKTRPLGGIADSIDYGVTASAAFEAVGPKFLRITDLQDGVVDWARVPWCGTTSHSSSLLRPGDIVFARTGATTGKSHLIRECPDDAVFASYLIRVRLGSLAEPRFVGHFFQTPSYWTQIAKGARGVAQPGVNATTLSSIEVPFPPLSEQRRIADVLDRAEALRAKRRAALAQLDVLTQSIFLDMFGDPTTNPKRWKRKHLGELLQAIDSGWSPTCLDRQVVADEWGVLKLGAVTWGDYEASENKALPPSVEPRSRLEVHAGDLLMVRKNTYQLVGSCSLVRATPPRLMMSDLIFRLRLRPDSAIDPDFLHRLLSHPAKRREIQKLAGGSAGSMPNVSKARLRGLLVEVPPLRVQRDFSERVAAVEKLRVAQRASLAELDTLFASLQHRAFRGEL